MRRRRDQRVAAQRLAEAERNLVAAGEKPGGTARAFWAVVRKQFEAEITKKDLDSAAATLGLDRLSSDTEALKTELDALETEGRRAKVIAAGIRTQLLTAPWLTVIVLAIVVVPPGLLWLRDAIVHSAHSPSLLSEFLKQINAVVLGAAGMVATAAGIVGAITKKVRQAVNRIEGYRVKLNEAIALQVEQPVAEVRDAQEDLDKLTADIAEARALMATTSDRLAEATREYASGTGSGRLLRFVRERVTNGEYAKHLGLVATVRRDFTDLSVMMSNIDGNLKSESDRLTKNYKSRMDMLIEKADSEKLLTDDEKETLRASTSRPDETAYPSFERIILYIDDLDRCPPVKVVEVLQAVHLLLSFPLFVVIVAVDARWVSRALEKQLRRTSGLREWSCPCGCYGA